jgi:hypothetical protein
LIGGKFVFVKLRHKPCVRSALASAALLLVPLAAARADDPPLPSAEDVLHKVLATVTNPEMRRASSQYRSVQHTVIEKLDDKGHLREREDRVYDVGPLAGGAYASLVEKNGKSLSATDLADEKERRQRFIENRGTQKFGGGDSDRVPLDSELFDRYKAEVLGRETVNGRSTIVLHFWPRAIDLPVRRRQDYVLNKLTGKVWIDEKEWEIVKVDANLTERVRVVLGLVAALDKVDLSFEQIRMTEGVYLPLKLSANFEGRKLFSTLHERVEVTWTGQRPAEETTANPAPAPGQPNANGKPRP